MSAIPNERALLSHPRNARGDNSIWRFTGTRLASPAAERRAQQLVAISFYLLAPYIAAEALRALATGDRAETSIIGIVLTVPHVRQLTDLRRAALVDRAMGALIHLPADRYPHPGIALVAVGGDAAHAVMAGDHANDVAAARGAGVPCIFAAWGYGLPAMSEGASAVARDFGELVAIARQLLG